MSEDTEPIDPEDVTEGEEDAPVDEPQPKVSRSSTKRTQKTKSEKTYAEPDGIIVNVGETPKVKYTERDGYCYLSDDVWVRWYPHRSKTPSFTLLYRKGIPVLKSALKAEPETIEGP